MDPMCEKYYSVSPYVYCHNNPVYLTDHDGRDDYYDCYGSYLGTNNEETVYIYIAYDYKKLKNGEYVVTKDTRIPLSNASLSAESWSNIFTNILERMPDVDTSKLHNDKISVTVVGDGDYIISQYNDAGNVAEVNATTNKNHLDAHITAYIYEETNDNRYLFSTRSNIQNILGTHEYKSHFEKNIPDGVRLLEGLKHHYSWGKTTRRYKQHVENSKEGYKSWGVW